jgi:hypothetical protein
VGEHQDAQRLHPSHCPPVQSPSLGSRLSIPTNIPMAFCDLQSQELRL